MWHLRRFYQNEVSLENLETDFFACSSKPVESTPNKAKPSTECRENTESSVGLESSLTESRVDSESKELDSKLSLDSESALHSALGLPPWCGLRGVTNANKKISHCGVAV